MIWALLAKFLLSKPSWVQAVVLGLCTGLFAAAAADANDQDPAVDSTMLMVLIWAAVAGVLYYVGFTVQSRRGAALSEHAAPRWLYAVYAVVWLLGLGAAILALFGEGGFKVAILAVVPLVLLAPTAVYGLRQVTHRVVT
jgi:heme/copper-type cytochrome/quinol oxidase subunit 2